LTWLEIRPTSAGAPTSTVYARSRNLRTNVGNIGVVDGPFEFVFPVPYTLVSGVIYALVVVSDMPVGGTIYLTLRRDSSAPTYSGGQVYTFDGAAWNAQTEDLVFSLLTDLQDETKYSETNQDSVLAFRGVAGDGEVSMGFKVPFDVDVSHIQLYLRLKAGAVMPAGSKIWPQIRTDSLGLPNPVSVLMDGLRSNATVIDFTTFRLFTLTLAGKVRLTAGTQYHLCLVGNYAISAANCLELGYDGSAPTYPDGLMAHRIADSLWLAVPGSPDLCFYVLGSLTPFVELDAAFSTDNISYGSFLKITDNPGRVGSPGPISFTGETKRYWKIRATPRIWTNTNPSLSVTPTLRSWSLQVTTRNPKTLTVDFGLTRNIGLVELYGHPTEGGFRRIYVETRTAAVWTKRTTFASIDGRKKGGGATATSVAELVTTDGDYLRLDFGANVSCDAVRVTVEDNIDEWARVLELIACRVEDWSSRVCDFTEAHRADYLLRKIDAKTVNLTLQNDDGFLSVMGTAGGYNGEIGAGVRLILEVGYYEVADRVRIGVFYVDEWLQQSGDPTVQVRARDGVKRLRTQVEAKPKTGFRTYQVIEYLANLAGVPTQDMDIDRSSNAIDFFAAKDVNAYEEIQLLSQATALGQAYFDKDGYLVFRNTGSTAGNTGIEQTPGVLVLVGTRYFPAAFVGSKMYCVGQATTTLEALSRLRAFEYDIPTGTWRLLTNDYFFGGEPFSRAVVSSWNGELYLAIDDSGDNPYLLRWRGTYTDTAADWEYLGGLVEFIPLSGPIFSDEGVSLHAQFNERVYFGFPGPTAGTYYELNLTTALLEERADFSAGETVRAGTVVPVTTNAQLRLPVFLLRETASGDIKIRSLDPDTYVQTLRATIASGGATQVVLGADYDGSAYVYACIGKSNTTYPARFIRFDTATWTVENLDTPFENGRAVGDLALDAVEVVQDALGLNIAFGSAFVESPTNPGKLTPALLFRDEGKPTAQTLNLGPMDAGCSFFQGLCSISVDGTTFVFGRMDTVRVFEYQVRKTIQAEGGNYLSLSSDPGGNNKGSTLLAGDERGGQSQVVNLAIVKSTPLIVQARETVWTADGLPWGVVAGIEIKFRPEVSKPCVPTSFLQGVLTFASGAAGTMAISTDSTQRPIVTISITASGKLTALTLTGTPTEPKGSLVAIVAGTRASKNRYGLRQFSLENNYIYDNPTIVALATLLVGRFNDPQIRIQGLAGRARWDLLLWDQIQVKDESLSVLADFFVTAYTRTFVGDSMTVEVMKA
jgi:hypothetical protein